MESGRSWSYRAGMPVSLLTVGEHLSLEFEPTDVDAVQSYIREQYPDVRSKAAGIATIVKFGGEEFTFQNDWDDPCLISHSANGDELLRDIHAHFEGD
jgi:hypothetical protein